MSKKTRQLIFITGACGFVGNYLVNLLIGKDKYKLVLNCRERSNRLYQHNDIEYTDVDMTNHKDLGMVFEKYHPDIVIHLAGITRLKDGELNPEETFLTNYLGTKNIIKKAASNNTPKFIFVSSDLARNHQSVIGITKYLAESFIQKQKDSSMNIITIRLPNISRTPGSVHLIFEDQINKQEPITITDPAMSRRFINGNEAAEYISYGIENGADKDLWVINKPAVKVTELAEEMMDAAGRKTKIKFIGARPGEKLEEESYGKNDIEPTSFKDLALLINNVFGTKQIDKAHEMLTWKPGFNLNIN